MSVNLILIIFGVSWIFVFIIIYLTLKYYEKFLKNTSYKIDYKYNKNNDSNKKDDNNKEFKTGKLKDFNKN